VICCYTGPGAGYDPLRSTMSLFIADWMQQLGFDVTARPTGFSVIVDKGIHTRKL